MDFFIGDQVIFINENLKGEIVDIRGDILVVNCLKLDLEVHSSKVIKINKEIENIYSKLMVTDGSFIFNQDDKLNQNKEKKDLPIELKINISKNFELDLHLEKIIDNLECIHPQEILQLQLNAFYRGIFEAKNLGIDYLVVIHGIGKGVLKRKIVEFLEENEAIFFEADYNKYKGGAIEIKIN